MAQWNTQDQDYQYNRGLHDVVMLADKDGNVLNTSGSASNIPLASGDISGYQYINKFGYGHDLQSTGLDTIWNSGGLYVYPSTATVATVTGGVDDAGAVVNIQGLDENGYQVDEDVAVGSSSNVLFSRVFRARLETHPTSDVNVDDIIITVDGVDAAIIGAEQGQTLMALYTIPTGKTGYLLQFQGTVDKSKFAVFSLMARPAGGAFNIKGRFGTFGAPVDYNYPVPLKFTEGTDIEYRAEVESTMGCGAVFDLILVDNPV